MKESRIPPIGRFIGPDFEPFLLQVCNLALHAADPLLKEAVNPREFFGDAEKRRTFFQTAHRGFSEAQDLITDRMLTIEGAAERKNELQALRRVADGIAWQMIGSQLYIARRLYRQVTPPRLKNSNFQGVRETARRMTESDFSSFALISDLTSFVQIGDILAMDANTGQLSIVEVKEGEKNKKIMDFMDFFAESRCGYALQHFLQEEGKHTADQLLRIIRQSVRMAHVSQVLNNGHGKDPDSGMQITVPETTLHLDSYDERLSQLIDRSHERGWAIDVVGGSLFMAAYRGIMLPTAGAAFKMWWDYSDTNPAYPICNILQCMNVPLGLPLYSRSLRQDQIFDLLLGRCVVILGFHIAEFMKEAEKHGLKLQWSNRKKAGKMDSKFDAIRVDNKVLLATDDDHQMIMSGGMIVRLFFHGTTPQSLIEMAKRHLLNFSEITSLREEE